MDLRAFFKMTYGIYLITSGKGEQLSGYIANTAFQVTAEPQQIAISCHKENKSAGIIDQSGFFNLSVLEKETDAGLIGMFGYQSGSDEEKFNRVSYISGKNGVPVIMSHAIAYFECEVTDKFDVGTHYLFIGKVTHCELIAEEKEPLTYAYFRDEMKLMAPERAPTYIDKSLLNKKENIKSVRNAPEPGEKFLCTICAYVYDPEKGDTNQGISPGTAFEDLPEDWVCPVCSAAKSFFISEN